MESIQQDNRPAAVNDTSASETIESQGKDVGTQSDRASIDDGSAIAALVDGLAAAARNGVKAGIANRLSETNQALLLLVDSQLAEGEECFGFEESEKRVSFVIRMLPVIGSFARSARRHLLLVATTQRFFVLELKKNRFRAPKIELKKVLTSIPLSRLSEVRPRRGFFTSSLVIKTRDGNQFRYTDMLRSAAERMAHNLEIVRGGDGERPEGEGIAAVETVEPKKRRVPFLILGGLLLVIGGATLAQGDVGHACVNVLMAGMFLWLSRPR